MNLWVGDGEGSYKMRHIVTVLGNLEMQILYMLTFCLHRLFAAFDAVVVILAIVSMADIVVFFIIWIVKMVLRGYRSEMFKRLHLPQFVCQGNFCGIWPPCTFKMPLARFIKFWFSQKKKYLKNIKKFLARDHSNKTSYSSFSCDSVTAKCFPDVLVTVLLKAEFQIKVFKRLKFVVFVLFRYWWVWHSQEEGTKMPRRRRNLREHSWLVFL